jgi:hypothetical protein
MKSEQTATVGPDGVLTLRLPLGAANANKTVRVTVETVEEASRASSPSTGPDTWRQFVEATAGQWLGELELPTQGEYEARDQWP